MKSSYWIILVSILLLISTVAITRSIADSAAVGKLNKASVGGASLKVNYARLPLSFEANQGQADEKVKFLSRGNGYTLFLTSTEAVLALSKRQAESKELSSWRDAILRMKLVGANPMPRISGDRQQSGKSNYFIGKDPKKWKKNISTYAKVNYEQVYQGVDLIYYGNQQQLEYDFVVAPGTDPKVIRLSFSGAEKIEVNAEGNLVLRVSGEEIRFHKPIVYQEVDGMRHEIVGGYKLRNKDQVGFQIAAYDRSRPLVIDPVLSYSTYLGGSGRDEGKAIAVDVAGSAYVTGWTYSTDFPTTSGIVQTTFGGVSDAFVTKLSPDGSTRLYSTYLGGSGYDQGYGIAVDDAGNAYITGAAGDNFPTTAGALKTTLPPPCTPPDPRCSVGDAFVAKLSSDGSALIYSTYLGGSGHPDFCCGSDNDIGYGIAVDRTGNAYVTGSAPSRNFPTTPGAIQQYIRGQQDAFVSKLNPDGSALIYSTYLGADFVSGGQAIAVDAADNAYVTGYSQGYSFPTTAGAFQETAADRLNAFVAKLNSTGSFVYSTYLSGSSEDIGYGITIDAAGNAWVTGRAGSIDFPTTMDAAQPTYNGGLDAFVTKLSPDGSALMYSSYMGGSSGDEGRSIVLDGLGYVYVTGWTDSPNFPIAKASQPYLGGGFDAFIARFSSTGRPLIYSSYLGGSGDDWGFGIAVDAASNSYIAGTTQSADFPTVNAVQAAYGSTNCTYDYCGDAFVAKISQNPAPPRPKCRENFKGHCRPTSVGGQR